jgi:hypothetical protein
LEIYPSHRPNKVRKHVPSLNAIEISDRIRFTLRRSGEPFKYHGVMTKRYPMTKIMSLTALGYSTIWRYVRDGIFPEPALIIQKGKNRQCWWLYHQAEPMVIWLKQMRARGIVNVHLVHHAKEIAELHRRLRIAEAKFLAKFGQPFQTEYEKYAGPYGVMWLMDDEKIA